VSEGVWADAALAVRLLAVAPHAVGGIWLRARPGPQRRIVEEWIRAAMEANERPRLKLPLHITDDRLLGGVSLAATLREGRLVTERGLLARADGGVVVVSMAERLASGITSHLDAALDAGAVRVEREGIGDVAAARVGVVAMDEGIDDEAAPSALVDRLGFRIDLEALDPRSRPQDMDLVTVPADLGTTTIAPSFVEALCRAAQSLGIASLRAPLLAAQVARAHAAVRGRTEVDDEDAEAAARLVLGPRAVQLPSEPAQEEAPDEEASPPEPSPETTTDEDEGEANERPLEDVVLDAAESGIPAGLLDDLMLGRARGESSSGSRGAARASTTGGRPAGVRAGTPRDGERLSIVDTLRAAAPWQRLRRTGAGRRVEVRKDDFRLRRYQQRTETLVIFAVDASGSAALRRLAEAKGAVEQVLADCYVRRDHVALIGFRGTAAELLLPPTRSLARVRRRLAGMAGGGTTPLATGIDAALALALDARRRGRSPIVVLMTDGRANVARDGQPGPARAAEDALASAGAVRQAEVQALFLDTAPRPRPRARQLADAMGARYLPLPYLDATGISQQVQDLAKGAP